MLVSTLSVMQLLASIGLYCACSTFSSGSNCSSLFTLIDHCTCQTKSQPQAAYSHVPRPFLGVRYCPQPILGGWVLSPAHSWGLGTVPSPFLGGLVLFTAHISQLGARGHQTTHALLLSVYFQKNMFGEGVYHPYGWYSTPSTLAFPCTCTWESKGGGL